MAEPPAQRGKASAQVRRAAWVVLVVAGAGAATIAYVMYRGGPSVAFPGGSDSIAGTWEGDYVREDIGSPGCTYEGTARFVVTQAGSDVQGTMTISDWSVTPGGGEAPCIDAAYMIHEFTYAGTFDGQTLSLRDSGGESWTGDVASGILTLQTLTQVQGSVPCAAYCGSSWVFHLTRS